MQEGSLSETNENDLLALMIKEKDDRFTEQIIKDSAFTFLFAGHETTASALPGILMYLAKVCTLNYLFLIYSVTYF